MIDEFDFQKFHNDFVSGITQRQESTVTPLINKAMAKHGYIIGETISKQDIAIRGLITQRNDINTLTIDGKKICSWIFEMPKPIVEGNQTKMQSFIKFKEH